MTRRQASHRRCLVATLTLLLPLGCASLNYPEPSPPLQTEQRINALPEMVDRADAEALVASEGAATTPESEEAISWSELTKLARAHTSLGQYPEAEARLEQASTQLAELPATQASRRTVFGLQARLARRMAIMGQDEEADALADKLFDQAEAEPAIAGTALVELALMMAERRESAEPEPEADAARLRLLRIAFDASEASPASSTRLQISYALMEAAQEQGDWALARRAIDRTILDAQRVEPLDRVQAASLRVFRARIAAEQGELETAQTSAAAAVQIFREVGGDPSNLAVAQAALAEILAQHGEITRASEVVAEAEAHLSGETELHPFAQRTVLTARARVARAAGDRETARSYFERALTVPELDFDRDATLISEIRADLEQLDQAPAATSQPNPAPQSAP